MEQPIPTILFKPVSAPQTWVPSGLPYFMVFRSHELPTLYVISLYIGTTNII